MRSDNIKSLIAVRYCDQHHNS